MNRLLIKKLEKSPDITLNVPGSKSITQRALIIGALSKGKTTLINPLESEDTLLLANALENLGIRIEKTKDAWTVHGTAGNINNHHEPIYMGNNGTGIRFLASFVSLGNGDYILTGSQRMQERPIKPLLSALNDLGVNAFTLIGNDFPPFKISTKGLIGGRCTLDASQSSQFLSSIMLVAPYAKNEVTITLQGEVTSKPYYYITKEMMKTFGITIQENGLEITIPRGIYKPMEYQIEGDASSASYFFAAAALTQGRVRVKNIPENPLQGDANFVNILKEMGCEVKKDSEGTLVEAKERLRAIEIDMSNWPDLVPTLAVVAAFSDGTTRIFNVKHLRIKETDRLSAVANELSKVGVKVEELDDGLIIHGTTPDRCRGAIIETYNDHRIAMAFSLVGLLIDGIEITNPSCVAKSFPNYWDEFSKLYL